MASRLHSSDRPALGVAEDLTATGARYREVRRASEMLCEPLTPEDSCVQSMPDVSPAKWHLAHTTWFFETFVLEQVDEEFSPEHPDYRVLFNSYYNAVGRQFPRNRRGVLSRPSLDEVREYRRSVDERLLALFDSPHTQAAEFEPVVELGLHHEQQHQELMLTDIKHVFWSNPIKPAYRERRNSRPLVEGGAVAWIDFEGGVTTIGHQRRGFHFDNERPVHEVYLQPFRLASRPVTNGEFLHFMNDGGYQRPDLWLSDGWDTVKSEGWISPLYWEQCGGQWRQFTLSGPQPLNPDEPVCHVSFFEADAFARWADARLPTEAEWEAAARSVDVDGNFVESGRLQPAAQRGTSEMQQMFGDVWEWTASPYVAYPGYRPLPNALGEYNGKFMCNQFVLRGGSCATPASHIRPSYRNFFQPEKRWQFSGIRLAKDA